jgi:hypothetical protein
LGRSACQNFRSVRGTLSDMRTLLRAIVWLALIVWLGGLFFFPITAWAAFSTIPDTHAAGTIVAKCLRILHGEGFFCGCLIILVLAIGIGARIFRRGALVAVLATLLMLGLTAYSQFAIIPRMESYRIAAGGAIDNVPKTDPRHVAFDRLHNTSETVAEAVMIAGIVLVVLLARSTSEPVMR